MSKITKVLNCYAGLGGNRKLWKDVEVTAVEMNPEIAAIYKDFFPDDNVIVGDAHQYILEHYKEYGFIWSSPPCQSHTSFRHNICVRFRGTKPCYPDMKLYQEALFLKHSFDGKWVIENVNPYYEPLINPTIKLQRHLFWSNFTISNFTIKESNLRTIQIPQLEKIHNVDLSSYKLKGKRQVLRNCVNSEIGLHILNESKLDMYPELFNK